MTVICGGRLGRCSQFVHGRIRLIRDSRPSHIPTIINNNVSGGDEGGGGGAQAVGTEWGRGGEAGGDADPHEYGVGIRPGCGLS